MNTSRGAISIPAAIIIAGALVAFALIWIYRPASPPSQADRSPQVQTTANPAIPAVTGADHILGNPNAPIKIVEYSDLSCPFCKEFNQILIQVMNQYGTSGNVAWVYRSLPLLMKPIDSSGTIPHPNSKSQAEALECVAQLGGNSAFFSFERQWFSNFSNGAEVRAAATDRAQIDSIAKTLVDPVSFNDCMASSRFGQKIEQAYQAGLDAGITGTPTTYIFTPSGSKLPIVGAQSYSTLKTLIDTILTTVATSTQQN